MTRQTINTGTGANSNDGDPLRTAFTKINSNFEELYTLIGSGTGNVIDVVGPLFDHADHNNVTVTLDSVNDRIILDAQLSSVIKDIKGSVFADDSTLLVDAIDGKHYGEFVGNLKGTVVADDSTVIIDGTGSYVNLDGTVKGNIIPDQNITYDIGSPTNRFRDLWLSGTTINLGNAQLSATPTGSINLPAGSTIPGITEAKLKPALIFDDRQVGDDPSLWNTYFNDGAPALPSSTIIDHATWLWATNSREPDFQPSVYSATIDGNGNITNISLDTANYYTNTDQQWDGINTDNMIAIDPGIDITDPAAIAASSQVIILPAGVLSASDTVLSSNVAPTTLLGLTDVLGDGTPGQFLKTDGAGNFSFDDPVLSTGDITFTDNVISSSDLANDINGIVVDPGNRPFIIGPGTWNGSGPEGLRFDYIPTPGLTQGDCKISVNNGDGTSLTLSADTGDIILNTRAVGGTVEIKGAVEISKTLKLAQLSTEPNPSNPGMLAFSDGSWGGSGAGLYFYYNTQWNKVV